MAEIRKIDVEKIICRCKEKGKDFIPSNWYIDARKSWSVFVWAMIQIRNGANIRSDSEVDKFIHKYWEYIEEHAFAYGKEIEDGTEEGESV